MLVHQNYMSLHWNIFTALSWKYCEITHFYIDMRLQHRTKLQKQTHDALYDSFHSTLLALIFNSYSWNLLNIERGFFLFASEQGCITWCLPLFHIMCILDTEQSNPCSLWADLDKPEGGKIYRIIKRCWEEMLRDGIYILWRKFAEVGSFDFSKTRQKDFMTRVEKHATDLTQDSRFMQKKTEQNRPKWQWQQRNESYIVYPLQTHIFCPLRKVCNASFRMKENTLQNVFWTHSNAISEL